MPGVKKLTLTAHARVRLQERRLALSWVEDTVRNPDWTEPDSRAANVERRFRTIGEASGRILRVACVETETSIRVISLMFDRNARRKA